MPINILIPPQVWRKAKKLGVEKKFEKALQLFKNNPFHPSLNTELLQPKQMGIWSFRVDRKARALFFWRNDQKSIEVINLTVHYH